MTERPILFSAPMVRAILSGEKTQTRRALTRIGSFGQVTEFQKTTTPGYDWCFRDTRALWNDIKDARLMSGCPYGRPGNRLWVRETFSPIFPQDPTYNGGRPIEYDYAATYTHGDRLGDSLGIKKVWKPGIHMPRVASRITLEVTGLRVERLQDISEKDAKAEGVRRYRKPGIAPDLYDSFRTDGFVFAKDAYEDLWESINGAGSWDANPWVWVIELRRIKP